MTLPPFTAALSRSIPLLPSITALRSVPVLVVALTASIVWTADARAELRQPDCTAMGGWAAKYDQKDEWQPNALRNQHRFARLFVQEETTQLFGKPLSAWTEADAKTVRDGVIACRRETKDRELSGRYNAIQSALIGRVANFAKDARSARERAEAAMAALASVSPSPALLRLQLALAQAEKPQGYAGFQRIAQSLPPQAMKAYAPAQDLGRALPNLPEADIIAIVTKPATDAATGMRKTVVEGLIADIAKIPGDPGGLATVQRVRQGVAKDFADIFAPEERQRVDKAFVDRQTAIGEEITAAVIGDLAKSSTRMEDAFADIARRAAGDYMRLLSQNQAVRIREAADARRKQVAEPLLKEYSAEVAKLPESEESLQQLDTLRLNVAAWPGASDHAPRFLKVTDDRRTTILAAVNRKEAGTMRGRVYQSKGGELKLEFVDRDRVLISSLGNTMPAKYVEEKDGRVSLIGENLAVTLTREGRMLRGMEAAMVRVK